MLKVVFDSVIFIRSLINPESYCGRLVFQYSENYQLCVSLEVIEEILDVLKREEIKSKFKFVAGMDVKRVLEIISYAKVVNLSQIHKVSRDPNDDKFLATAEKGKCDYLVTEDKDLLVLKKYKRVKIINTAGFLKILSKD